MACDIAVDADCDLVLRQEEVEKLAI